MDSAKELGNLVQDQLRKIDGLDGVPMPSADHNFLIEHKCPRFSTGEGKASLGESVRGKDLFILTDVCNYSIQYHMQGMTVPMSPDDHYMDVKRTISAVGGKAQRICVIMPYLYGGRQDRRGGRESLDAALMLRELVNLGVSDIITFDAHDPRVENAIPVSGFDNLLPTYQTIKTIFKRQLFEDPSNIVVVSPDEGGATRNLTFAGALQTDFGIFYKQRDLTRVNGGKNRIIRHEYLGEELTGRDVLVSDDVLASGESLLSVARHLKKRGARKVVFAVTFPQFTEGLDAYHEAYEQGCFYRVLSTNLTYRSPQLLSAPWYVDIDLSKYLSSVIASIHFNMSVNRLLSPQHKIQEFLHKVGYNPKG